MTFHWRYYDDNGLIKVENNNYSVLTRFIKPATPSIEDHLTKYIVRTKIPIHINGVHTLKQHASPIETTAEITNDKNVLTVCNSNGIFCHKEDLGVKYSVYIRHFKYKTIQEYLETKCQRGYPMPYRQSGTLLDLKEFFNKNALTVEKLDFVQKWITQHPELPQDKKDILIKDLGQLWNSKLIKEQLEHR